MQNVLNKIVVILVLACVLMTGCDTVRIQSPIETLWQDPTNPTFDLYFTQANGQPTNLTNSVSINDTNITIDDTTFFSVGDYIGIFSGASLENRYYFGDILAVNGNVLTLDSLIDFPFDAGDPVISTTRNLAVDGSTTCKIFSVRSAVAGDLEIDITRLIGTIIQTSAGDDSRFGNIAGGLTNGILLRIKNGITRNLWNVKTNGDFGNIAYDVSYSDKAGAGLFSTKFRYTISGTDKHGAVIRLVEGDLLELYICDDLTPLVDFRIVAGGHEAIS